MRRFAFIALFFLPVIASAQQWATIETADRPITVDASGIVTSANTQRFGTPPNRRWRLSITYLAQEGSRVKAGDVLARFDGSATDDRIRQRNAELNSKRSELESLLESQQREIEDGKVRLAAAHSAADKAARKADADADLFASLEYKKLVEQRDVTRQLYENELQRVELVASVRASKEAELRADIQRLESELAGAKRELEAFTITAPGDGMVIVGTNHEGQKLDTSDQVHPGMVVIELADEHRLIIKAEVPEFVANRVETGQEVEITIDAIGSSAVPGEIIEVGRVVRRQSQYSQAMVLDVSVSLPEAVKPLLRSGMSAQLDVVIDTVRDALAVPDEAIQYRDGKPGVSVRGGGWTPVNLGPASSGGMRIVASGLDGGEEVALQ